MKFWVLHIRQPLKPHQTHTSTPETLSETRASTPKTSQASGVNNRQWSQSHGAVRSEAHKPAVSIIVHGLQPILAKSRYLESPGKIAGISRYCARANIYLETQVEIQAHSRPLPNKNFRRYLENAWKFRVTSRVDSMWDAWLRALKTSLLFLGGKPQNFFLVKAPPSFFRVFCNFSPMRERKEK
jgi:hypothetical protein